MNCIVVGDCKIGKSTLCLNMCKESRPDEYIPSMLDIWKVNSSTPEIPQITLFDVSGDDFFKRWRVLCYPQATICLLCYSLDSLESLNNAYEKWFVEMEYFHKSLPIVLIGLKSDNSSEKLVSNQDIEEIARLIEAQVVLEYSLESDEDEKETSREILSTLVSVESGKKHSRQSSNFFERFKMF